MKYKYDKKRWDKLLSYYNQLQCYHLFGSETHTNRAITAQSWDYLVYLRDLAVHKDRFPHLGMMSQSAKQLCNYDII